MLNDHVGDGDSVQEACTEIQTGNIAQPPEVSAQNTLEAIILESIHFVHGVDRFLRYRSTALVHGIDHVLDIVDGHQTDQKVNDHRHAQQNQNGKRQSFQYIF